VTLDRAWVLLASRNNAVVRIGSTREPEGSAALSRRVRSRPFRAAVARRLALGLLMALFAIVSGWMLIPPEAATDQATVDWYTR
jgi:hypothetical protein